MVWDGPCNHAQNPSNCRSQSMSLTSVAQINSCLDWTQQSGISACAVKKHNEDTSHITRCCNPGRSQMFTQTAQELLAWMDTAQGNALLITALASYLQHRRHCSMQSIVQSHPELHEFAQDHGKLGWDNFMEGHICKSFFQLHAQTLVQELSKWSIKHGHVTSSSECCTSHTANGYTGMRESKLNEFMDWQNLNTQTLSVWWTISYTLTQLTYYHSTGSFYNKIFVSLVREHL